MKLTWLGHGCWYADIDGCRIMFDPFFSTPEMKKQGAELPTDFIFVTHGHSDHCADVQTVLKFSPKAVLVGGFELVNWFQKRGVKTAEAMNPGGQIQLPCGSATMTTAIHSSSMPDGSYGGIAAGYLLQTTKGNLYFAGDTGLFGDMALIRDLAHLKAAILPIGDKFTMGPEQSLAAIQLLKPEWAIPSHYNTWPPIVQDAQKWSTAVNTQTDACPMIFQPGETKQLQM